METGIAVMIPLLIFTALDVIIIVNLMRHGVKNESQKHFLMFAFCVMAQQFCSLITYGNEYRVLSIESEIIINAFHIVAIICMTACSFFWLKYLLLLFPEGLKKSKVHSVLLYLPFVTVAVFSISSPWTKLVFYIENGMYHAGNLVFIQILGPYIYTLVAVGIALIQFYRGNRKRVANIAMNFLVYILPSIIGILIQFGLFRGGYTQIGISVGMLLMYLEQYMEDIHENERLKNEAVLNKALEEHMKIIQSMGKVYFSSYYIDIKNDTYMEITSKDNIRDTIGMNANAQRAFEIMCDKLISPEHADMMREFVNLETLSERLKGKKALTLDYIGKTSGWSQAYLIDGDRDEDGVLTHVFFATREIHDEKMREIEQNRTLEEARLAAEEANNAKTSFLFNMSHDIRTPMNAIIGFRELLEKHQDEPEKRADYLRKIGESSAVLLSIINNVLEMARIEKGVLELDESAWSMEQFADSLYSVFCGMIEEKNIRFSRVIDVEHRYVFFDPIKVREVFINIISNSYKYTNAGGEIKVYTKELPCDREGYVLYQTTVSDTGIGMSEEFLPHIFEEFSREKNSTETRIEGTGLGMPIVKRLVEIMDGTIEVKSKKGQGTTFIVTIPHRIADRTMLVDHAGVEFDPALFKDKRILLTEDNELNAEIATEILSEAGFLVDVAENGEVCVDMVKKADASYYDLILMDIQMPKMNGYEATRIIREMDDRKKSDIKIVAMTANAFEEDRREAIRSGMNGHLAKPIDVKELMKELAQILMG